MRTIAVEVATGQGSTPAEAFLAAKRELMEGAVTLRKARRRALKLGYLYLGVGVGCMAANLAFHGWAALVDMWAGWCLAIGFSEIIRYRHASHEERFGFHIAECAKCGAIGTDGADDTDDTSGAHVH